MSGKTEDQGRRRGGWWSLVVWGGAALFLLWPVVAMQFRDDVAWTASDFLFAGALVAGVGLGFELALRRTGSLAYRLAAGLAMAAVFLLVWLNGAVGLIGSENENANLAYVGVIAVVVAGAAIARFRPAGLARTMLVAALAQALVPLLAVGAGLATLELALSLQVLGLTGLFAALWLASAWLFRAAAEHGIAP